MYKRGQVTIFLVVGIVILAIFASILYFTSYVRQTKLEDEATVHPLTARVRPQITSFVESCIQETAVPGIYFLGIQGGIIYPDDPSTLLLTENAVLNYGYLNGINQLDTEKMEEQLNRFVEENVHLCLDFSSFAARGIFVTEKKLPKVESILHFDKVVLNLKYKLEATSGGDTLRVDFFSAIIELPLGKLREQAMEVIDAHGTPGKELPVLDGTFLTVFPFDITTTIYSLSEEAVDPPIVFMFAVQKEVNTPPQLDAIPNQVIRAGERFAYQLTAHDAENDLLTFSSDSPLFPITGVGIIEAAPEETGTFIVTFTVEDTQGEKDEQEVRFVVQE